MTWSVNGILTGANDAVRDTLRPLRDAALAQNSDPAAAEQFDAAANALTAIFASGAVGPPDRRYAFTLVGHANPGHEPRPGWSTDCVTVTISQMLPPVPEEAS